ncbi:MAG: undecaprenyldiphospho-muramoylpentapeptide beta-N-acetylglucosaminyltransferase [Calditrichaceae bacterium]|nr:undecaprenyldiphospho-muramoylpentapeptide beta-N-acetylglucosaminyltransferase [Calditrichaceae bacterium]
MNENAKKLRVIIAGGGTGGHVFPALNIAEGLNQKWQCEFLFFGTKRGLESKKVPGRGYKLKLIPVAGFQRRFTIRNLTFPFKLLRSMQICRKTLREFDPHLAIGSGGYVMGPVLKSAIGMGVPTVIQEQNSFPGVTTRLLAGKADIIFMGDPDARHYLSHAKKLVNSGNPISFKRTAANKQDIFKEFALNQELKTILIFGGSQGARNINRAIKALLERGALPDNTQLLWQTGELNFIEYNNFINENQIRNVVVRPFIDAMDKAYAIAEFAICRAGAITISELKAAGLPAILIPLTSAAGNHQYKNAAGLQQKQAVLMVEDNEMLSENLIKAINQLLTENDLRGQLAENIHGLYKPDTIDIIINEIEGLLKDKYDFGFELRN